ncbi:MAG: hypothetical protein Q3974_00250 [Rothia sp. (in: high G+C Gram-positive bacteria)]|nr:hypothetical protein [Rothia sp. (in: high G+C Gram-positive bacteria)]
MKEITVRENLVHSPMAKIVRAALIATTIVTLLVLAFTWPTKTTETKDLPISISGPSAMVDKVKSTLDEKLPGTFDFVDADSREQAEQQIKERDTYGAIILTDGAAPEVLTASAASTATNNMLTNMATQLTAQTQAVASEAKATALKDGIAKGNKGVAALQSKVDAAQKVVAEGKTKATQASASLETLKPQLAQSQAQLDVAQQQIDALKPAAEGKGDAAKLARTQIDALTKTVDETTPQVANLQKQIDEAQKIVDNGGGDGVKGAQQQLAKLTPQLQKAKGSVAQAQGQLDAMGAQGKMKEATTAKVTNVVELSDDDSTGAGLTVAAFPLVMGGMLGGILMMTLVQGVWARLGASTLYAIMSGLVLTLVLHTWFGFLEGHFNVLWLAFMLSNMATSFFIIGLGSVLGKGAGIALGAITTMFIANPISAASSPWEFILKPWGAIGQHMVPGASAHLLRSLSYFPDANTAPQWWTLVIWALVGLILATIGFVVARKNKHHIAEPHMITQTI